MNTRYYLKSIFSVGIPLLIGNFSHYMLQIADTAMVGHLGNQELGGMSMAALFTGIFGTFIWTVSLGTQALTSRRYGFQKANPDTSAVLAHETGRILDHGMLTGFGMGCFAFLFSFSAYIVFPLLIVDKAVLPHAFAYMNVIRWGYLINGSMIGIFGFVAAINKTKVIMIANLAGNIFNIFFNYVLIYGKLGFPAFGIRGAAFGSLMAQAIMLCIFYRELLFSGLKDKYYLLRFENMRLKTITDILKTGIPVAIQNSFALLMFLSYQAIIGTIGTVYLAATHIMFSVFRINKTLVGGFAQATAILVGNALGADNKEKALAIFTSAQIIAAAVGSVIMMLVLFFPQSIASLFSSDAEAIRVAAASFRFFAIFFFIEVMGYTFEMVFTGNGWGRFVLFSEATSNIIFILLATFTLVHIFNLGIYAAWTAFALYQVAHAGILTIGFFSKKWMDIAVE